MNFFLGFDVSDKKKHKKYAEHKKLSVWWRNESGGKTLGIRRKRIKQLFDKGIKFSELKLFSRFTRGASKFQGFVKTSKLEFAMNLD